MLATAIETGGELAAEALTELFGLWLAAASAGDAHAQFKVASCYLEGNGCTADPALGAEWLQRAAAQKHAAATAELTAQRSPKKRLRA